MGENKATLASEYMQACINCLEETKDIIKRLNYKTASFSYVWKSEINTFIITWEFVGERASDYLTYYPAHQTAIAFFNKLKADLYDIISKMLTI